MEDEHKSNASMGQLGGQNPDQYSVMDQAVFSFYHTLYNQKKSPNKAWEIFQYGLILIEMITLSFFCIDRTTNLPTPVSKIINFVDTASLGYLIQKHITFLSIGFFGLVVLLFFYHLICALLHVHIMASQPWIVRLLRFTYQLLFGVFLIPLLNLAITQFDCVLTSSTAFVFRGTDLSCFGGDGIPGIVGFVLSIVFLLFFFCAGLFYRFFIFNHNPKYGGFFSAPSSTMPLLDYALTFGCVFAMRTLVDWPFWRFAVTFGSSAGVILIIIASVPYYHHRGNLLTIVKWSIFGFMRAFLELSYLVSGFINHNSKVIITLIVTIACGLVGLGCGIGFSVFFNWLLTKREKQIYLLTEHGLPLTDLTDITGQGLPKLKNPSLIEPSIRFIQQPQYRTYDFYSYADLIYITGIKRHKTNAHLHFNYGNFLSYYRKNHMKAHSVYRTARASMPDLSLRFVLFCKTKEQVKGANVGNEMANAQFQAQMAKAEDMHETAKSAMRDFFSNLAAPHPRLKLIPNLLHVIVDNENKARTIYEDLINTHPTSVQLLRQYASLLIDIYNDEDAADIILLRADQIEEDAAEAPVAIGGLDPQDDEKKSQASRMSGMSRASRTSGMSGQSRSSLGRRRRKKKRMNTIITDIGGSGNKEDVSSLRRQTCIFLFIVYMEACIGMIVGLVIYVKMTNDYSNDLTTLREVCRICEHTTRTATFTLEFGIQGFFYGFVDTPPADGKAAMLVGMEELQKDFLHSAHFLTEMLTTIYDLTSYHDPWEAMDMTIYEFIVDFLPNPETGVVEPVVTKETPKAEILRSSLTSFVQKAMEMGGAEIWRDGVLVLDLNHYCRDIVYIIANSMQPFVHSLKKAVIGTMLETDKNALAVMISYTSIIAGSILFVLFFAFFLFVGQTRSMAKLRREMLMNMLDVPKAKLQGVIRRLISTTITDTQENTLAQGDSEEEDEDAEFDPENSNHKDDDDVQHELSVEQEDMMNDNERFSPAPSPPNKSQTSEGQSERATSRSVASHSGLGDTQGSMYPLSNNPLLKSGSTIGFDFDQSFTTGIQPHFQTMGNGHRDSVISLNPMGLGLPRQDSAMSLTQPGTTSLPRPDSVLSLTQLGLSLGLRPMGQMNSPLTSAQMTPSSPFSSPHMSPYFSTPRQPSNLKQSANQNQLFSDSASEYRDVMTPLGVRRPSTSSPSPKGLTQLRQVNSLTNLNQASPPGPFRGIGMANQHSMSMPRLGMGVGGIGFGEGEAPLTKEEQRKKREMELKKKREEAEQKRKEEEARQQEEALQRQKEEEERLAAAGNLTDAQKGYVVGAVDDSKWYNKAEAELARLMDLYNNLPSPVSGRIILLISSSIITILLLGIVLIVYAYVQVATFSQFNTNIVQSGLRTTILAMIEFLNLRLVFNFPHIVPSDPTIDFPESTNPVWTGFQHISANQTLLYELLNQCSHYFQGLHSAAHYGKSKDSVTGDTMIDTLNPTRLGLEDNEKTLLRLQECFAEESDKDLCKEPERVFDTYFPIYGLSTLISQLNMYIELMKGDGYEKYTADSYIPRYISSACRNDLRSGINQLTNEILASTRTSVLMSQTVLIGLTASFCVYLIISYFSAALSWVNLVMTTNLESHKLMELLPIDEDKDQIELLPSMRTGFKPLDEGRELIIEAVLGLVDSVQNNESKDRIKGNMDYLMTTVTRIFALEEKEMEKREYGNLAAHQHAHLVLRQRVTVIAEKVLSNNVATMRLASRVLTRLFDVHFLEDDTQFGDTIPESEKVTITPGEDADNTQEIDQ
ncbi:hypothetical protein BLNAU_1556 [Blattamonas nauphoetae]|uniref:TmcB/TmcC TPR repeats domain-containing protein n=1 Tax=Blattamonas nauphoetae TaxID=2049346 RepID=A0ABQ9YIC4_9EUKA|nr:hypothetical protein BLNAU_1556 [Blattamonas nauphoetae]